MSELKDLVTKAAETLNELREREITIAVEYLPPYPEAIIKYDLAALERKD